MFIGEESLPKYLRERRQGWIERLRQLTWEQDYQRFVEAYEGTGRRPYHPAVIIGLIVYGMLRQQWSLRQLEMLAQVDAGAWLVCGGLQPDHSTIGRFIVRHEELLTDEFFVEVTRTLVRKLSLSAGDTAIDGTTIEAVASRLKTLRAEAAREASNRATAKAEDDPSDAGLSSKAAATAEVAKVAEERASKAKARGKDPTRVKVARSELEAVVQTQKDGTNRPSYKASIMVHESGLIVGQHLNPSSETSAVAPMLEQHRAAFGCEPRRALMDAGYHSMAVLSLMVTLNIDALCPAGKASSHDLQKQSTAGKFFLKNQFKFVDEANTMLCPANKLMVFDERTSDKSGPYVRYRGVGCETCPLKPMCTKSSNGRTVKRYAGDDVKDAMRQVLEDPRARARYRSRAPLVERPFAELKEQHRFRRFHRRGRAGASVELALHCIAFNIGKAVRGRRGAALLCTLWVRSEDGCWRLTAVFLALT